MKPITLVGAALILIGLAALLFKGIPYQSEENNIKLGPIEAEIQQEKTFPVPRLFGVGAAAVGVALVIAGRQRA